MVRQVVEGREIKKKNIKNKNKNIKIKKDIKDPKNKRSTNQLMNDANHVSEQDALP